MLHKTDGSLATSADARQGYDEGPRNDVLNFPTIRTGPLCGEEVMIPVVPSMIGFSCGCSTFLGNSRISAYLLCLTFYDIPCAS